jgi:hypothetical protein
MQPTYKCRIDGTRVQAVFSYIRKKMQGEDRTLEIIANSHQIL